MSEYFNHIVVDPGSNSFRIHNFMDGRKKIYFIALDCIK